MLCSYFNISSFVVSYLIMSCLCLNFCSCLMFVRVKVGSFKYCLVFIFYLFLGPNQDPIPRPNFLVQIKPPMPNQIWPNRPVSHLFHVSPCVFSLPPGLFCFFLFPQLSHAPCTITHRKIDPCVSLSFPFSTNIENPFWWTKRARFSPTYIGCTTRFSKVP